MILSTRRGLPFRHICTPTNRECIALGQWPSPSPGVEHFWSVAPLDDCGLAARMNADDFFRVGPFTWMRREMRLVSTWRDSEGHTQTSDTGWLPAFAMSLATTYTDSNPTNGWSEHTTSRLQFRLAGLPPDGSSYRLAYTTLGMFGSGVDQMDENTHVITRYSEDFSVPSPRWDTEAPWIEGGMSVFTSPCGYHTGNPYRCSGTLGFDNQCPKFTPTPGGMCFPLGPLYGGFSIVPVSGPATNRIFHRPFEMIECPEYPEDPSMAAAAPLAQQEGAFVLPSSSPSVPSPVPGEELARRRAICEACPLFQNGRCEVCDCSDATKLTPWLGICKLGKW